MYKVGGMYFKKNWIRKMLYIFWFLTTTTQMYKFIIEKKISFVSVTARWKNPKQKQVLTIFHVF